MPSKKVNSRELINFFNAHCEEMRKSGQCYYNPVCHKCYAKAILAKFEITRRVGR